MSIKVTIWNEFRHEKSDQKVASIYPNGLHQAIADQIGCYDFEIKTATLDEPSHGLTDDVLENTDVLVWWGHMAHQEVDDAIVEKVYNRVLKGMGLIVLHSGHHSKIMRKLMGTTCNLRWRQIGEKQRVWTVEPSHPIAQGVPNHFELEHEEMYGERFDIPAPDELVFVSWYAGGDVFRSGCCYTRGSGRIFYFQPGHEEFPTFYNENVTRVIKNAVYWAAPRVYLDYSDSPLVEPLENI